MASGTSKRFSGTWPEGYRKIRIDESLRPKKPITKALVRALPDVEIGAVREVKRKGGA